jgi:predicted DNA binding CopG/RHH family protein
LEPALGWRALFHYVRLQFMIVCMRTTISLDDRIFEAVKRRAAADGRSVSAYIAGVLDILEHPNQEK